MRSDQESASRDGIQTHRKVTVGIGRTRSERPFIPTVSERQTVVVGLGPYKGPVRPTDHHHRLSGAPGMKLSDRPTD
jgi:hypothetical protein